MTLGPSRRLHGWALLAGLMLLGILFVQLGPDRILTRLLAVGWNFPVIVGLFALHECTRAVALQRCLLPGDRPPLPRLLEIQFACEAVRTLTQTGQAGSEPVRAWMLVRHGVPGARASGAAISEVLANSCSSAAVTATVLGYALAAGWLEGVLVPLARILVAVCGSYVVLVVVAVIRRTYVIGEMVRRVGMLPLVGHRLRVDPAKVRRMEDALLHVLRESPATALQVTLLEAIGQALLVVEAWWTITSMGVPITFGSALVVEGFVKLVNVVQLAGVTEGGFALVFAELGMAATVGFTMSFVQRLRSFAVAALVLTLLAWSGRESIASLRNPPAIPS